MPLTGDSQVNKKAFGIAINSQKVVRFHPLDREKTEKKLHRFDLGSDAPPVLVECKSHTWTQGGNMPSAKMTVWNEAMYYFHLAPSMYRKILFVLKHSRREVTLASYYLRTHGHMVPDGVEIWEYDLDSNAAEQLR